MKQITMPSLRECPFCHKLPTLYVRGAFIRGGCAEHLEDAIMQPAELPEQAVLQWNNIVEPLAVTLSLKGAQRG